MDNYESINAQLVENQIKLALLEVDINKVLHRINLLALIFLTINVLILGTSIYKSNSVDNYSCSYQHFTTEQN